MLNPGQDLLAEKFYFLVKDHKQSEEWIAKLEQKLGTLDQMNETLEKEIVDQEKCSCIIASSYTWNQRIE